MRFYQIRFFFLLIVCISVAFSQGRYLKARENPEKSDWKIEVESIDKQIKEKTDQKNLALSKAAQAQNQGDRLQFNQNNLLDARRYWQVADAYRQQAALLDLEIELLKNKRAQILKEHNVTRD
jgi:hypothetical protein